PANLRLKIASLGKMTYVTRFSNWPGNAIARYSHIQYDMRCLPMNETRRIERRVGLRDLRVLVSVIESGSMGKAARMLATSQPAISRSIANLEHTFGVRLLDRSAYGVEPTLYGRALLRRGIAVFDELGQGLKDVRFLANPNVGDLAIATSIAI